MSTRQRPRLGLSLMVEDAFRQAVLPLFESGQVEVLEWSFELGWSDAGEPPWVTALLDHYAQRGALWGHGVTYSLLSADAGERHARWLDRVSRDCRRRRFLGVSEHYGFMGNDGFDVGAPLPMPPTEAAVQVGADALARLAAVTGGPVGIENLALAFSHRDVWGQGRAVAEMLSAVDDSYLVLDLHNVFCQSQNYRVDAMALLETYPLEQVRCMHVSGGSWSEHDGDRFRRDTHDGGVPNAVFELVERAISLCPGVEAVILERLGRGLDGGRPGEQLREDFARLAKVVGS